MFPGGGGGGGGMCGMVPDSGSCDWTVTSKDNGRHS